MLVINKLITSEQSWALKLLSVTLRKKWACTRDSSRDNVTVVQRKANNFRILAGLTEALLRCREVKHLSHAQLSSEGDILNKP